MEGQNVHNKIKRNYSKKYYELKNKILSVTFLQHISIYPIKLEQNKTYLKV